MDPSERPSDGTSSFGIFLDQQIPTGTVGMIEKNGCNLWDIIGYYGILMEIMGYYGKYIMGDSIMEHYGRLMEIMGYYGKYIM